MLIWKTLKRTRSKLVATIKLICKLTYSSSRYGVTSFFRQLLKQRTTTVTILVDSYKTPLSTIGTTQITTTFNIKSEHFSVGLKINKYIKQTMGSSSLVYSCLITGNYPHQSVLWWSLTFLNLIRPWKILKGLAYA